MLGIDRNAARYTFTAALVIHLFFLVYTVRSTLFIFTLALLLAYLLSPLVNALDRLLPWKRTRTPALALSYILFIGLLVLIGSQIGARVVQQATELRDRFPTMIGSLKTPSTSAPPAVNNAKSEIADKVLGEVYKRSGDLISLLPAMGIKLVTVAANAIYLVIIPILSFFFLKDGAEIRQHLLDLLPDGPRRALMDDVMEDIHLLLAHYMRALVVLAVAAFTAYTIFFSIAGIPYSILLAALAGMLEFIPMVGPLTAAVVITIV